MQFKDVIGQNSIKQRLIKSHSDNRMAHTQLFLGPEGSGTLPMALAFAQYVNCKNPSEYDSCGVCSSCVKFNKNSHADMHFYFPNNTTEGVKKNPESVLLLNEWRDYLKSCNNYAQSSEWFNFLGVGNKQGSINVRDAKNLIEKMSMKPYEATYKIVIIWMAEKLNTDASNKLLKTLEEPPANTLIILIAERYELIIPTVRSRAQLVKFNSIDADSISEAMANLSDGDEYAYNIGDMARIANGNWNEAVKLMNDANLENEFFVQFRNWLRLCFAPKDYKALFGFNQEIGRLGREKQKSFLHYGLSIIHYCVMMNVNNYQAVKLAGEEFDFVKKFSPFINEANQDKIYEMINEAIYHVERNAHGGILFTDLSFKLVNLLKLGRQKVK